MTRRIVLHMPGAGEGGFTPPDPVRPELAHRRAGLTLPLDRLVHETLRQQRRGALLLGPSGSGKSRFMDVLASGRHLPSGLSPIRVQVRPDGDPSALSLAARRSDEPRLFLLDGLDAVHGDGNRRRLMAALADAVERHSRSVFVVASRPSGCPGQQPLGPSFIEFHMVPLDPTQVAAAVQATCVAIGLADQQDELVSLALAWRRERALAAASAHPGPLAMICRAAAATDRPPTDADELLRLAAGIGESARDVEGLAEALSSRGAGHAAGRSPAGAGALPTDEPVAVGYRPLPGGSFVMGSPEDEEGRWTDEGPRHQVRVPAFELAAHPVTNLQYERFVRSSPDAPLPAFWADARFNGDHQPVVGVWWEDATAYAAWAGGRLPSEAEWEYACRAATVGPRYAAIDDIAWWYGNSGGELHPVATRAPNAWGLHDMLGNCWEFVEDDRHDSYHGAPVDGSAWVEHPRRPVRLLRGGSWADAPRVIRAATRLTHHPGPRVGNVGFRVARDWSNEIYGGRR
jgi:formylglycine-generating enzyme required for sulfatase activity